MSTTRHLLPTVLVLVACAPGAVGDVTPTGPPKEATGWKARPLVSGLNQPWGMAWLPDGTILVTEKRGRVLRISKDFGSKTEVKGGPEVFAGGQGGLMDVSIHPDFGKNNLVYFTASEGNGQQNRTVVWRAKLSGNQLTGLTRIFANAQFKPGGQHFGSRILWLPDKTMLVSIGDGGNPPTSLDGRYIRLNAQDIGSHFGKVLRLTADGKPASGNPFAGKAGAKPEVWSYGHRNIQGMARDPKSGRVFANEHGARGGDEVNVIRKGANYGWPKVTFSREYSGPAISDRTSAPGMVDPIVAWTPCPAPSGLAFYTGDKFPNWRGDLFSGGLMGNDVRRINLDDQGRVLGQDKITIGERVRDVRQGPDGYLYVITDQRDGQLIRIEPSR